MRWWRAGTTETRRTRRYCTLEGCDKPRAAQGLCKNHYGQKLQKAQRLAAKIANPRPCAICGVDIPPSKHRRGPISYCSEKCHRVGIRQAYFRRHYGLTIEQVEEMAKGGCAICGTLLWNGPRKVPQVDHDHVTGKVRGILCSDCNTGIGKLRDDPAILRAAIRYLRRT